MRAADSDRQFVADRLKNALDEGRLSLGEYDDRLREAYAARTYGDLDGILADLPGVVPLSQAQVVPASPVSPSAPPPAAAPPPATPAGPDDRPLARWLVAVWSAWLLAVSINVVIWLLVSVSAGQPVYFWPMWVAGPWGVLLVFSSLSGFGRRSRTYEYKQARRDERRAARDYRRQSRRL
jgi:hypothetical protein